MSERNIHKLIESLKTAIIKEERERQGLSYSEFAKKANVTGRAISYWEKGKRGISVECADRTLKALGISFVIGINDKEVD